ncbi:uncharacterized protein N7483_007491 [Penicillium malachiteum]|uniref:uncharacterized protein n=1 Tax=Penicillium malachiteum TaxID=1324776 RepID=UPI0025470AB9|nr:uncharacterized protein N7483_007491 [Penicillium malachiteum]KAJ5726134.1 hypothetical protein N7483_007491 [Penicillium malachiteum]
MKTTLFWASVALFVPRALAISATSTTSAATTGTSTTSTATCTASLITTLCDYPEPDEGTAVASSGRANCWDYCNANPPCSFVIFVPGNPTLGTGTCWLYPGESYNSTEASTDCSDPYLEVYDEPTCSGGSATTTSGGCAATATPSAIAEVCDYPEPADCDTINCVASTGAVNCLSLCTEADSCSYALFYADNEDKSQYLDGSCWIYPSGTYDASSASTCNGTAEQYVYDNPCPKPIVSSTSSTGTATGTGTASVSATGTAVNASSTANTKNSAPTNMPLSNPLAIGVAMLMWAAI